MMMMMLLDQHAQNNSRFSAHACQRITEFLAELEFSPSICSFCSNWLAIIGNIWFLHSELAVVFWMVGFRLGISSAALALLLFCFFVKTIIDIWLYKIETKQTIEVYVTNICKYQGLLSKHFNSCTLSTENTILVLHNIGQTMGRGVWWWWSH